ncbi:hypothetical protein CNMCM8927_000231 [Aspergillus lentulus]|uniref:Uncharacterized protein n=1 Tax=Aspergillus lentulus TaxID=293939 RepID=A0AAN5YK55_ASPLE|nr:hypothetical protein CNMCM8927_000231 [Aspergillus lentulus]
MEADASATSTWDGVLPADRALDRYNMTKLINDVHEREHASRFYQRHLEILIDEGGVRLQQECHRSNQLEERVADLQWITAQLESTITQLSDDGELLRQSLALERMKVQELQSQLITILDTNDTLTRLVSKEASGMPHERQVDVYQLTLENLRLQDLISKLQITQNKDQAALKSPEEPLQVPDSYPYDCSSSSSDGSSTVVSSTGIGEEKSRGTSTQAGSKSASQTSNHAGMAARS